MVILSSDGINDSPQPWPLGIELRDRDPVDLLAILVAVRLGVCRGPVAPLPRLDRPAAGRIDTTTLARLDGPLRAALDL